MKLEGQGFVPEALMRRIEERLRQRGLGVSSGASLERAVQDEAPVDAVAFHLRALGDYVNAAQGLPLETHRDGLGRAVLLAKQLFRKTCQVFINEALARQTVFNGHARDAYALLSAQVEGLRAELTALRSQQGLTSRPQVEPEPAPIAHAPEVLSQDVAPRPSPGQAPRRVRPSKTGAQKRKKSK